MLLYHMEKETVHEAPDRAPGPNEVAWIRLENAPPEEVQHVLGDLFQCHPLLIEDAIKLNQRPKMDNYKNNALLTFFAMTKELKSREIAIVIGPNYCITLSREPIAFLDQLYREMTQIEGRMEHAGAILHALLDRCVDDYSQIINAIEDRVDKMERAVYRNPAVRIAQEIFQMKRTMHKLRRVIVEEKSLVSLISHRTFPYTRQEDDVYFADIYDHISRVVDSLDIFRESLAGLLELQMSLKSDRMNEIMKTLTLVSTIFMPLTFIVGVYGMNFKIIPELDWNYGYLYVWLLMLVVGVLMWLFFKKKRWF